MKKLDNKGFSLVELLIAVAILAIFMVSVVSFTTGITKNTNTIKKQVTVEQETQNGYENISSMVMQATTIVIKEASGDYYISQSAYDMASYVLDMGYSSENLDNSSSNDIAKLMNSIGEPAKFKNGKLKTSSNTISQSQREVAKMAAAGVLSSGNYKVFEQKEINVGGIYLGKVTAKDDDGSDYTTYNTLVFSDNKVCLNRNSTGPNFDYNPDNVIIDNCYTFTVMPQPEDENGLYLKLSMLSGGSKTSTDDSGKTTTSSKAGFTYTVGGTVGIRNAKVME